MEQIARRLSFGASKSRFPIHKYLSLLDELDLSDFQFIKLIEGADPGSQQEAYEAREYFAKLKYNYIELFSKRYFLDKLTEDKENWDANIDISEQKDNYKEAKRNNADMNAKLDSLTSEIVEMYEKFQGERDHLLNEIQDLKRLTHLYADEEDTLDEDDIVVKKKAKVLQDAKNRSSPDEWYNQMRKAISNLSDVDVTRFTRTHLEVNVRYLNSSHNLFIHFKPASMSMKQVTMEPSDVPIADIIEYAVMMNDVSFLVRETRQRIVNFTKRQQELDSLEKEYKITAENNPSRVRIGLEDGKSILLDIDLEYPQTHSRVKLLALEGIQKEIANLQKELLANHLTIEQALSKISDYLK